ncbi:hypothetical protein [Candidatus Tisiphia endosymbiont of Micropterix aruncella]|uniref:hypothetical protein n=1 Tax=Candidatus Tisiphia endosymbiont of Micropterix aruncella TaxID=3066271 RepID=UPI003AA98FCF
MYRACNQNGKNTEQTAKTLKNEEIVAMNDTNKQTNELPQDAEDRMIKHAVLLYTLIRDKD